jgi:mRNA interferase RelE/StbE
MIKGAGYIILYKKSVATDLKKLTQSDRVQVVRRIQTLALNPFATGSAKLQGSTGLYRIRQGDYRIIYQVADGKLVVLVIKVGHRREVYRA